MSGTQFKDSEFGRFQDGTQKVIRLAQLLGWKVEWRNAGRKVLGLTSPNRHKTFNIPTTNVNSNRVSSYITALWHHTDRTAWADVLAGHDDLKHDPLLASVVAVLGVSLYTEAQEVKAEREQGHLPDLEQRLRVRGEQPLPITEFEQPAQEDEVTEIESAKHYDNEPEWFRVRMFDEHGSEWWSTRIDGVVWFECRAHEEPYRTRNTNSRGSHTGSHSPAWQEGRERAGVTKHNRRIISRAPWRRKSDGEVSTAIIDEERADGSHTYLCAQCRKFRSPSPQAVGGHSASHRKVEPKVQIATHGPVPEFADNRVGTAVDLVGVWQQDGVSTPETTDLIDKVRALLGNPVDDAHIRRLEDKVTHLEEKNQHLQGLVDHYRTKATKAEGDLATLAELIQSVRPS
jgi:hypothetical protein